MAIIGNQLQSTNYASDQFSGNGSTVAYTLSLAPASAASIAVYISGLYQTPGTAYTISGTTLTFTGAPPSGTNNIFVLYLGVQNQNLVPVDGSITPVMLNNANVVYWSTSNTNVGIGNTSPTDKLSVGGTLRAGNTNVADLTASGNTIVGGLSAWNTSVNNLTVSGNVSMTTANTKIVNSSGNPILQQTGSVVQTRYVASGTRVSTNVVNSFNEPSTNYRVTITPTSTSSMIILTYYVPLNQASAANILTTLRSFRSIGGTKSYALTSAGNTNGSRMAIAGGVFRPQNGFDANDMDMKSWTVIDFPNTTSEVSYGFESKSEGTNTIYWGYSQGDNGTWGWDSDIVIVAQEIVQ